MYKDNYNETSNDHSRGVFIGLAVGLFLDALFRFQTQLFFTVTGYTIGQLGILDPKRHPIKNKKIQVKFHEYFDN